MDSDFSCYCENHVKNTTCYCYEDCPTSEDDIGIDLELYYVDNIFLTIDKDIEYENDFELFVKINLSMKDPTQVVRFVCNQSYNSEI